MLRNSEVTVGGLQLSSASKAIVVEQSETTMDSSSGVQLYPVERLGLGAQQDSLFSFEKLGSGKTYKKGRAKLQVI